MLKIRPEQAAALERSSERELQLRIRKLLLAEDYELVALDLERLDAILGEVLTRARALGLRQERSLTTYVRLWFAVGEEFDRHPTVARYLAGPPDGADARFDYLMFRIAPWEWEAIARELHPERAR
jgi:hypothetical protein